MLAAITVALGLALRSRQGRVRRQSRAALVDPERLSIDALGEKATIVQFSTELCTKCPGVHRALSALAAGHHGVRHVDVDLTRRPDLTREFGVMQTPTTLILDSRGSIRSRVGGVPRLEALRLELALLAKETADA